MPMHRRAGRMAAAAAACACAALLVVEGSRDTSAPAPAFRPPPIGPHTFGVIGDVAAGREERLFFLDAAQKRIAVMEGERIGHWLGAPGRGPGELLDPVSLSVGPGNRLYVLDRANQRIQAYAPQASVPLDFVPEDACFAPDGRLFVLGARDGYLLHELSLAEQRVVRSLLPSAASRERMLRPYHASGFLDCGPHGQLTVLPLPRPGIVRVSAAGNAPVRTTRIPGFRATRVRRVSGGVVYEAPRGGRADYASTLVPLGDARLLVQVGPVHQGASRHEFESLRTFVLSANGARLTELSPGLPRIMLVTGDSAVAVHTQPAPAYQRLPLSALRVERAALSFR